MTRKSRREIERALDELDRESDREVVTKVYNLTETAEDPDDLPHPELAVQPYPYSSPEKWTIAVPKIVPEEFQRVALIVRSCQQEPAWPGEEPVSACELWGALSPAQLDRERRLRDRNEIGIPPMLDEETGDEE